MSRENEEPLFIDVQKKNLKDKDLIEFEDEIRKLCESQPFAVLATQSKGIINTSLISFATSCDLKYIVFATPINTSKFNFIEAEENISILVDDRSFQQDNINQISALTIVGKGEILSDQNEILKWIDVLTEKHPNLKTFAKSPTTCMILVDVIKYVYVKKFQELRELTLFDK